MHEFRRYIEDGLNARGWKQADLVHASGLSRSHVSKLLRDQRPHLGQMPDDSTLEALAAAFGVTTENVRTAASRALAGYTGDYHPVHLDLRSVPTGVLLRELDRRAASTESLLSEFLRAHQTGEALDIASRVADFTWSHEVAMQIRALQMSQRPPLAESEVLDENASRNPASERGHYSSRVDSLLEAGRREWGAGATTGPRQRT